MAEGVPFSGGGTGSVFPSLVGDAASLMMPQEATFRCTLFNIWKGDIFGGARCLSSLLIHMIMLFDTTVALNFDESKLLIGLCFQGSSDRLKNPLFLHKLMYSEVGSVAVMLNLLHGSRAVREAIDVGGRGKACSQSYQKEESDVLRVEGVLAADVLRQLVGLHVARACRRPRPLE